MAVRKEGRKKGGNRLAAKYISIGECVRGVREFVKWRRKCVI